MDIHSLKTLAELGRREEGKKLILSFLEQEEQEVALQNLGTFLILELGWNEEASLVYRKLLLKNPKNVSVLTRLALSLSYDGNYEEGLLFLDQAVEIEPHNLGVRTERGVLYLLLGRYEEGWEEYGSYRKIPSFPKPLGVRSPLWQGEDLQGKTILIPSEQGAGDAIQFIRYASFLQQKGARVLFSCHHSLLRLFSHTKGVDVLVDSRWWPPAHDVHFFLVNSPKWIGLDPAYPPCNVPYVKAPEQLLQKWKERLSPYQGIRVGIAWTGNTARVRNKFRSIDPALLKVFSDIEGYTFISLQKPKEDLSSSFPSLLDWTDELSDFADTAALISELDLIITIDTSIAHLAGAMAKPVWTLLSHSPDWRWLLNRQDSPWYPTMRLFRQKKEGDWSPVIEDVCKELRKGVGTKTFLSI